MRLSVLIVMMLSALTFVASAPRALADSDFNSCQATCSADGNNAGYCHSRCATLNPAMAQASPPMIGPPIIASHGMKYACLARCEAQQSDPGYCRSSCAF